jgi:hypothetical protein
MLKTKILKFGVFIVLIFFSNNSYAQNFVGVSKHSYYHDIIEHLQNPQFKDGIITGKSFSHRDSSVFTDAAYADLFLYSKSGSEPLNYGTIGATKRVKFFYFYALASMIYDHDDPSDKFGHFVLGGGVRKKIWKFLNLDLFAHGEYDTQDKFNWEIGAYPLQSKWLSTAIFTFFHEEEVRIIKSSNKILFLGFDYLKNRDLDVERFGVSLSRRNISSFFNLDSKSSSWEIEFQFANIRSETESIHESRLKLFLSTVGSGPKGEARPGIHLNLSYTSANSTDFEGFGVELGFGAKQIDSAKSQHLYFTMFYNYSSYFYRFPSLKYGIGLVARF